MLNFLDTRHDIRRTEEMDWKCHPAECSELLEEDEDPDPFAFARGLCNALAIVALCAAGVLLLVKLLP